MLSKLFNKLIKKNKFLRRSQQKENTRFQEVKQKNSFQGAGICCEIFLDALASLEPSQASRSVAQSYFQTLQGNTIANRSPLASQSVQSESVKYIQFVQFTQFIQCIQSEENIIKGRQEKDVDHLLWRSCCCCDFISSRSTILILGQSQYFTALRNYDHSCP